MRQQRTLSLLTSTLTKIAPATPLISTLTRKPHLKPFRINTYKKGGEGEGGTPILGIPGFDRRRGYIQCVSAAIPEGAMPNPLWQN